jgi:hypothetical protein
MFPSWYKITPDRTSAIAMLSLVSKLHDAAVSPEAWPDALKALTDAIGVAGAALIISNKSTGKVDEVCFSGLSAEFKSDYLRHYAALDPYSPLLDESWKKLSDCLPDQLLRKSEWYNDFVLACGVRDILAARLVDGSGHSVILGIHQQIGQSFPDRVNSILALGDVPLRQATLRHIEHLSSSKAGLLDDPQIELPVGGNRFYFHIDNGRRYPDQTGTIFSTPDDAAAHAFVLAQELAQDDSWHGSTVLVINDLGQDIARVQIGC